MNRDYLFDTDLTTDELLLQYTSLIEELLNEREENIIDVDYNEKEVKNDDPVRTIR